MSIKVSIIIIGKNSESTIKTAIKSCITQNFEQEFEIIYVDGQSTDNTLSIVNDLIKEHKNIRLLTSKVSNMTYQRYEGVKNSKGNYVTFLDSDDYYHNDFLKTMYHEIEKNNLDVIHCSNYYVRENKIQKNIFSKNKVLNNKFKSINELFLDIYMHGFIWSKMFKKDLILNSNIHIPPYNFLFEDVLMDYEIFLNTNKVGMINKPLHYYVKNPNSVTEQARISLPQEYINCYAILRYVIDLSNDKKIIKIWRRHHLRRVLLISGINMKTSLDNKKLLFSNYRKNMKDLRFLNKKIIDNYENRSFSKFIFDFNLKK